MPPFHIIVTEPRKCHEIMVELIVCLFFFRKICGKNVRGTCPCSVWLNCRQELGPSVRIQSLQRFPVNVTSAIVTLLIWGDRFAIVNSRSELSRHSTTTLSKPFNHNLKNEGIQKGQCGSQELSSFFIARMYNGKWRRRGPARATLRTCFLMAIFWIGLLKKKQVFWTRWFFILDRFALLMFLRRA